ncbi:hypothetical protein AQJ23_35410 [Streptomyces antibioticus]|nr:hypothetical protein [Streptomyces antibioticus]KUN19749.1 hypothetical protein AQJ23_35410 [Streptomyces antibioticus]
MSTLSALADKLLSHIVPSQAAHAASTGANGCWIEQRVCNPHCPFWYYKEDLYWKCSDGTSFWSQTGCTESDNC